MVYLKKGTRYNSEICQTAVAEIVDTSEQDLDDVGEHICSRRHNSVQSLVLNGSPKTSVNLPFTACSPQIRNMAVDVCFDDFFHQLI